MRRSPISGNDNVRLVKQIKTSLIVDLYFKANKMDVSAIAEQGDSINLFECIDSCYLYYEPESVAGDAHFYEQLSKQDWYYSTNRWEHRKAIEVIPETGQLLEIGCGDGFFLKMLREERVQIKSTGLEINQDAINKGLKEGLSIRNENAFDFAISNFERFDIVCSFQVMEHIYNVREMLQAQLNLLKKGGCLVIAVPNNDSYVGRNRHVSRCLNMPPHHMGLWSTGVFDYIEKEFGLKNKRIYTEPFNDSAFEICHYTEITNIFKSETIAKLYFKLRLHKIFRTFFISKYRRKQAGHTIMAVFEKG